tara:strand:+ start:1607 stop:2488 length:882 start_codon:yes stop_codon:yes gene_type:complete
MKVKTFKSVLAMTLACLIWGLSGLYYDQLSHIEPFEVLAHRALWAMLFFSVVLFFQGRFIGLIKGLGSSREAVLLACSSLMISINWFFFIFSIQTGQAVQASFGYYIFPLVAVIFGYVFKGERFSRIQIFAILCAVCSIVALGFALRLVPTISLIIAFTFGAYGLIKSFIKLSSIESVTIETMVLAPVALSFLFFKYAVQDQENHTAIWSDLLLLMVSGLITGGPLILFAFATQNISYATVGILQYINPTLQFLVATFILLEPFNTWHAFALVFIWIGIIIYSGESWRLELRR